MSSIKDYVVKFDELEQKPDVYLIANAQDYTKKISPYNIIHANNSELFSAQELGEITSSLFKIGSYTSIFYSENEFIEYILRNIHRLDLNNLLVVNLARDGVKEGKKGLIPAFCDLMNIMYSGSNSFVVSLCRNKFIWSSVLKNYKIGVPNFCEIKNSKKIGDLIIDKNKKYIIKDICESASIDLTKDSIVSNKNEEELFKIIKDNKMIQEYIDGAEVEVPFFRFNDDIVVAKPIALKFKSKEDFLTNAISNAYNYEFYYLNNKRLNDLLCYTTKKVVELLGITGYGRVDFRIDNENLFYIFDVATMPYIIKHSSFAYWFQAEDLDYSCIYKALLISTIYKYLDTIK